MADTRRGLLQQLFGRPFRSALERALPEDPGGTATRGDTGDRTPEEAGLALGRRNGKRPTGLGLNGQGDQKSSRENSR